jgi:hypothetical protein
MKISLDFTAVLLPALTVFIWRVQLRRDRRDRVLELYRHFETDTMKRDRQVAWRYLKGWTGSVVSIGELALERDPERLDAYRACFGVLTFFSTLRSLFDAGHVDRAIACGLFEDARLQWASGFAQLSERDGFKEDGGYLKAALLSIQRPLVAPRRGLSRILSR